MDRCGRFVGVLVGGIAAALVSAACQKREPARDSESEGRAILLAVRARPASPLLAGVAESFRPVTGGLSPQFGSASGRASARVVLPARSTAPLHVEDAESGAGVDVSLKDARDAAAQAADGYVVYPHAHASGATLLHRALPSGAEDFLSFEIRPPAAEIAYAVTLGPGVKGLRLVADTLEMLDARGAPRLRVAPPYLVGADGARTEAALAVEGCAVDTSPVVPWGRPVTAPGAGTCTLRVRWRDDGVAYPAVLDPRWTSTASMAIARQEHTTTLLSTGKVLVTGGRSDNGTGAQATAEVYDPATKTWTGAGIISSPTGTAAPRRLHTAVQLGTTSNANTTGRVLVAGGITGTTSVATTSLYNPATNTWAAGPSMVVSGCASCVARHEQTATLLASGNVVLIGGLTNTTVLASAEIYNPGGTSFGTFTGVTAAMSSPRRGHTATLLKVPGNATLNNKVLVVGGNNGALPALSVNTTQVFDGVSVWTSTGTLPAAREFQTATALSDGRVVIAGGKTVTSTTTTFLQSTQIFNPASGTGNWTASAGTMQSKRIGHSATLLPTAVANGGKVILLVGGSSTGTDFLSSAEFWDGNTTWTLTSALTTATPTALGTVKGHGATLPGNNQVLVTGGVAGSTGLPTTAAGLYDVSFAVTCTSNSQCATGFCASGGVCCDATANDNNPCTTDSCTAAGVVSHTPVTNGTACDDATVCNGHETCNATGTCVAGTPLVVNDNNACTTDACNATTGVSHTPLASGTACDDATVCNGHETCNATGTCVAGTPLVVSDNNACTTDACNATTGVSHTPVSSGTACDDATVCNGHETCNATGTCVAGTPLVVNDNNACTTDSCNATTGVSHTPVASGTACDDATVCNGHETCNATGTCVAGTPLVVNDNNACTTDACSATTGVSHTPVPNGTTCNDSNACTNGEACQNGACTGGTTVTCAADQCHAAGTCVPATGCPTSANKPNGTACDDGNACTQFDVCQAGVCQGPTTFTCSAPNACRDAGSCNPVLAPPQPPSTQDLIGWWKLEGDGKDSSGGGHDLAIEGNVVPAPGRVGLGMKFDGTGCLTAPIWAEARMQGATGLTMMAWVDTGDDYVCPTDGVVMGRGLEYSTATQCYTADAPYGPDFTGNVRAVGDSGWGYPGGFGMVPPDAWTLVAMTWDGHTVGLYLNGIFAGSYPHEGVIRDGDPTFNIGCMNTFDVFSTPREERFMRGTIDEAMLYRRPLSNAEIAAYYAAADPCVHPAKPDGTTCDDANTCTQVDSCQAGTCVGADPATCTQCALSSQSWLTSAGLAARWAFDDYHPSPLTDSSGNGNGATAATGSERYDLYRKPPLPGNTASLDLSVNDAWLVVPSSPSLKIAGSFTVSSWVRLASVGGTQTILSAEDASTAFSNYNLHIKDNRPYLSLAFSGSQGVGGTQAATLAGQSGGQGGCDNGGCYIWSSATFVDATHPLGTWRLVTGVYDDTTKTLSVYLDCDGAAAATFTTTGVPYTSNSDVRIGRRAFNPTGGLHGSVDEVAIWRRAFARAEIQQHTECVTLTCDPSAGACKTTLAAEGSSCNDSNDCTQGDHCQSGTCTSGPAVADGTACNDGSLCTRTDLCQTGVCVGGNPVVCSALDQCHALGTCAPATGVCPSPAKASGTTCDDGNACTQGESCVAGSCQATSTFPVVVNLPVDDPGTLAGSTYANDINASGKIAAVSTDASGQIHAAVTAATGPLTDIGSQIGFPSTATAINDANTAVGFFVTPGDGSHVFRYASSTVEDLGAGGDGSVALGLRGAQGNDINNSGQIAGVLATGGLYRGFRYTDGVGFEDIGSLGGAAAGANRIDDAGNVYGFAQLPGSPPPGLRSLGHAIMFNNPVVGPLDLNNVIDPFLEWTLITALGASGDVVVGAGDLRSLIRPFRMHQSTGAVDEIPGGWEGDSWATGVNTFGDTVGTGYLDAANSRQTGFVFTDQIGFKKLNDMIDPASGWDLVAPSAINDSQEIVGWGYHNGAFRAFHLSIAPQQVACGAANSCGGGGAGEICLWADGVVDVGGGHYVAVFGFQNPGTTSVHPTVNQVLVNGTLVANPQPAPPAWLPPGSHTAGYLPKLDAGQTITWNVDGKTVSASAPAAGSGTGAGSTRVLPKVPIGTSGYGVMIGGKLVTIQPDLDKYSAKPRDIVSTEPLTGDEFLGTLTGKLSVGPTGAATYTVPIKLPPGIAGMVPNLNLVYNSQGGDGIAGQGWDLTGLSMIHRCARTLLQDGQAFPVTMDPAQVAGEDARDSVCLDGARLFAQFDSQHSYTMESKEFGRITSTQDSVAGPETFTVLTKTGETRIYGSSSASRVQLPVCDGGSCSLGTSAWLLDRVIDQWGNYYEIKYNDDVQSGDGQKDFAIRGVLVTQINYTGHVANSGTDPGEPIDPFTYVKFRYETQPRPDVRHTRIGNTTMPKNRRLSTISTPIGTYTLTYLPDTDPMLPSRLGSIGYCAATGSAPSCTADHPCCLGSLQFDWKGGGYDWDEVPDADMVGQENSYQLPAPIDVVPNGINTIYPGTQFADLDGDGRPDFVQSVENTPAKTHVWRNNGHGWTQTDSWNLPKPLVTLGGKISGYMADIDGDGQLDLIHDHEPAPPCQQQPFPQPPKCFPPGPPKVFLSHIRTNGGWQELPGLETIPVDWGYLDFSPTDRLPDMLVDMNGDGKADIVRLGDQIKVLINMGSAWTEDSAYALPPSVHGKASYFRLADINRDGLVDLVRAADTFDNTPPNEPKALFNGGNLVNSDGTHWSGSIYATLAYPDPKDPAVNPMVGDIDGDGLYDSFWNFSTGLDTTPTSGMAFSTGFGYTSTGLDNFDVIHNQYLIDARALMTIRPNGMMADLNGDGLVDLLIHTDFGGTQFLVNTGTTWAPTTEGRPVPAVFSASASFMDLDGDGISDLVESAVLNTGGSWLRKSWLNKFRPAVIWGFPNGLAAKSQVSYEVITAADAQPSETTAPEDAVYKDLKPLDPGTKYTTIPLRVVDSVIDDNGLRDGTASTTTYQYDSLRGSPSGHGPQGFRTVTANELASGASTTTTMAQVYPYTGMAVSVGRSINGFALTATDTEYHNPIAAAHGAPTCNATSCPPTEELFCTTPDCSFLAKLYPPRTSVFVYPKTVTDKTFLHGLGQPKIVATKTEFRYDGSGNPLETTVTSTNWDGETYVKDTTNIYGDPDSLEEQRGKVTYSTATSQRTLPQDGNNQRLQRDTGFEYGIVSNALLSDGHTGLTALALLKTKIEVNAGAGFEQHTVFVYDRFGNIVSTTSCAADFDNCGVLGATGPAELPFRHSTTSYDPADFTPPNMTSGLIQALAYGQKGRFPVKITNAADQKEYTAYDPDQGVIVQKTGPNGIHSCYSHDAFGLQTSATDRCGSVHPLTTTVHQYYAIAADPTPALIVTVTRLPTGVASFVYRDALGRQVGTRGPAFDGGLIQTGTIYDAVGRVARESRPFEVGTPPGQYAETVRYYDPVFGRLQTVDEDLGQIDNTGNAVHSVITTTYDGPTITTTRTVGGQTEVRSETKNGIGKVNAVVDAKGGTISYTYDGDGRLTKTTDGANNQVEAVYDRLGRKIRTIDPDLGTWKYTYDGFSQLTTQSDALNQLTVMSYDVLGRMTSKTDSSGTAQWIYDVAAGAGLGKLAAVVGAPDTRLSGRCAMIPYGAPTDGNRTARWFTYTEFGDVLDAFECADGAVFATGFEYDDFGRKSVVRYPEINGTQFAVGYHYTNAGYLHYVNDAADLSGNSAYWVATAMNATGQVTGEYTRNGVETLKNRNPSTGWLMGSSSIAHGDGDTLIQSWGYEYDEAGNLVSRRRSDAVNGPESQELFTYDALNRVKTSEVKVPSSVGSGTTQLFDYDGGGNLIQKGGNTYTYGTGCVGGTHAGPHAVCTVGTGQAFAYDGNGNMVSGNDRTLQYSASNKAIHITSAPTISQGSDTGSVEFVYGADGNRVVQAVEGPAGSGTASSARTVYVGLGAEGKSLYERTTFGDGKVQHVQFIYAGGANGGNAFALRVKADSSSNADEEMRYYHVDHLGSVTAMSDERGHVISAAWGGADAGVMGYDPWGARRSPEGNEASSAAFNLQVGHRQFTGHEEIPDVGLVNMNGRVYDPVLGRFLSPDPNVQVATDLQSYNRYSYVLNNPLRYTDPTGYFFSGSFDTVVNIAIGVAGVAVCAGTTGIGCGAFFFLVAAVYNSSSMYYAGASVSQIVAVNTVGLLAGLASAGVGSAFGTGPLERVLGGAVGGAVGAAITSATTGGGNFWQSVIVGAGMGAFWAAASVAAGSVGAQSKAAASQDRAGSGAGKIETVDSILAQNGVTGRQASVEELMFDADVSDLFRGDPSFGVSGPYLAEEEGGFATGLHLKLGFGGGSAGVLGLGGWIGLGFNLSLTDPDIFFMTEQNYYIGGAGLQEEGPVRLGTGALEAGTRREYQLVGEIEGVKVITRMQDPVGAEFEIGLGHGGLGGVRYTVTTNTSLSETVMESSTMQTVGSYLKGFGDYIMGGMR